MAIDAPICLKFKKNQPPKTNYNPSKRLFQGPPVTIQKYNSLLTQKNLADLPE
jgi:hypothetical protein